MSSSEHSCSQSSSSDCLSSEYSTSFDFSPDVASARGVPSLSYPHARALAGMDGARGELSLPINKMSTAMRYAVSTRRLLRPPPVYLPTVRLAEARGRPQLDRLGRSARLPLLWHNEEKYRQKE